MTLTWYNCNDDIRVINKTLTDETEDTCTIYNTCSMDKPILKVKTVKGNYIKFEGSYYFILDTVYNGGYWLIECKKDVLKTYETDLLNSEQLITRSETDENTELPDNNMATNLRYIVEGKNFGQDVSTDETTYILGVI